LFLLIWMVFLTIAQQLASVEHVPARTSDAIGSEMTLRIGHLQLIVFLVGGVLILIA
jgi:hypothetical protein